MSQTIVISSINYDGELASVIFTPQGSVNVINLGMVTLPFTFQGNLLTPPQDVYGTYTILVENGNCPNILNVPRPITTTTTSSTTTTTTTISPTTTTTTTQNPCL